MSRHRLGMRAAAAVVAALAASLSLFVVSPASAVRSHRVLNDTQPVRTGVTTVDFPIEHFGLVADLPSRSSRLREGGRAPFGQARFRVHGSWTAWQTLDQDGAQAAGHFTGALVSVDDADAYQVRHLPTGAHNWRAAAINTTDGPTVTVAKARSDAATASAACRSRADWGADESISGWARGDTPTYYPVQALTVHHTAGSNDPNQDYAATVRAIYSFHVQTNGWSDIGYQYLVDGHGVVYEGRSSGHTSKSCLYDGGDGSDFAHQAGTDYVVTGAHVANYNSGNAGVALMGCYESTSACSGDTTPPATAVNGLDDLLASLSTRHHLDPQGSVHYVNPVTGTTKDVKTISGHRDWEATACPGANLYGQLPSIRTEVAARMAPTAPSPTPTPTAAAAAITSASCSGATCTFAGTGTPTLTWAFGNGTGATGSPVSVTYKSKGNYTVTLTDGNQTRASRSVQCTVVKRKIRCTT